MNYPIESEKLIAWFSLNRRELPWREDPSPYRVWVSEVMLQQTQVSVVIPYFERWMHRFPTIASLADAAEEEVMKLWEGLGYYSRARALHQGAKQIVEHFQGELPVDQLESIKGIGPYTKGALLSFAFHKRAAAVDGNVVRVLTRYFYIEDDVAKPKTQKLLREIALKILPDENHWLFNEGLIELGATVCQKVPKCRECPLKSSCKSYLQGEVKLPYKSAKSETIQLLRSVAVIQSEGCYLIQKVEEGKVMAGLHEFPYFDKCEPLKAFLGMKLQFVRQLPEVTHGFTKYRATLFPALYEGERKEMEGYFWLSIEEIRKLPFSSGHRKILNCLPLEA